MDMGLKKKLCRVCGKSYEACYSAQPNNASFNWKEVSCSPECGSEYLQRVIKARAPIIEEKLLLKKEAVASTFVMSEPNNLDVIV